MSPHWAVFKFLGFGFLVCFALMLTSPVMAADKLNKNTITLDPVLSLDCNSTKIRDCADTFSFWENREERAKRFQTIYLATAFVVAVAVIAIVYTARQWIATTIPGFWRGRSKAFRVWAFGSFFWVIGTLHFVWLVDPYGSRIDSYEFSQMIGVIIVPPFFLGALWFGYKRFVD